MAILRSGSLPSNYLPPHSSSLSGPAACNTFNVFPIKLSFRASTATNPKQPLVLAFRNPQVHSVLTPENATDFRSIPSFESKDEDGDNRALLDILDGKFSCFYDCKQVHCQIVKSGALSSSSLIGNKLVVFFLKSGESLDDARRLFDEIPERTVPAYAALIGSYCRCQRWDELFMVFALMIRDGMLPNKYLVPTILKACSAVQLLRSGKMIHGSTVRKQIGTDIFVGMHLLICNRYFHSMQINGVMPDLVSWNALLSGFAQNGEINLAFQSLEGMQEKGLKPNVNTWNGIISGFVQNGYFEAAVSVFNRMLWFPVNPNVVTLVSILPACAGLKDLNLGKAIHAYIVKSKLNKNIHVEGSLINIYSKCGRNNYAEDVFMIAAYSDGGKLEAALGLFRSMQSDGLRPDEITYNTLFAGHVRHGKKNDAFKLLHEMTKIGLMPNIISFNVLISGFQQSGLTYEALKIFQMMQSRSINYMGVELSNVSIQPNPVTATSVLAACADLSLLRQGKEMHGYIMKNGFDSNIFVSSALVDMYAKCHDISSATKIFWKIKDRNAVAWNSLIAGHINNKDPEEALKLFNIMLGEGSLPSLVTFMILLPTCGDMAALRLGRALHGYLLKSQDIELDNGLAIALIGMYAKCRCIQDAKLLFDSVTTKDAALCNAMISACSALGTAKDDVA
ncbi:hypothetical protein NMG60_11017467 [Bertholletia excelsa]